MLSLSLLLLCAVEPPAPRPPDVLLILVDDLNDWTGYLGGHPGARTPHLDRLAERGVAFTNAHCASPVCNPSRTSMLGGVRPEASRVRGASWKQTLRDVVTLPRHFADHGYHTVGTGKIFHGSSREVFDEFLRPGAPAAAVAPEGSPFVDLGVSFPNDGAFDWRALDIDEGLMPDHKRVTMLAERLMQDDEEPLFVAIGFHKPHIPWYVPKAYFDLHPLEQVALPETLAGDLDDVPAAAREQVTAFEELHPYILEHELWAEAVRAYLAAGSFVDAQLGRLMDALDSSPRADRTVVLFVSDHGWHLGEKGHWRKTSLWEESTRIPLIVVPLGDAGGGQRCSRPVDTMSVYPTLCELSGLPVPEHVRDPSLAPLLADPETTWPHAAVTTFEQHGAIRTDRWRLVVYEDGELELYDHERDPGEFHNLAGEAEYADVVVELREQLERVRARN